MKTGRLAILAVCVCLLLVPLAAYETGGDSAPTTECNDGVDNDRDTYTDGDDPGCNQPYYKDDQENNIYDLVATSVFSDIKPSDSDSEALDKLKQGPSAYYGWKVGLHRFADDQWPDEVVTVGGTDYLNVTWVNGSEQQYEGGDLAWSLIELDNFDASNDRNSPYAGLIDSPAPGTGEKCGDGVEQDGETTLNCPEDSGLPSQIGNADGTISGDLGKYSASGGEDDVKYVFDLELVEYHTEDLTSDTFSDSVETICESSGSCDDNPEQTFYKKSEKNHPDFFLKDGGTEIWAVYPVPDGETKIGEVDDYGLDEESLYSSYTKEETGSCSQANCTLDSNVTRCTSYSTYSEHTLSDDSKGLVATSHRITTDPDSGSYQKKEHPQSVILGIDHDDKGGTTSTDYYGCDSYEKVKSYSCESLVDCNSAGEDKGGETYYTFSGSGDYPVGYRGPDTMTYQLKEYDLATEKVFDLDPADNPHPLLAKAALFNDNFDLSDIIQRSFGNDGWFSYVVPSDGRDQGNDYSVSLSRFSITTDGSDNFVSRREESHTYDADGQLGRGDGFIAISEGNIAGSSNQFLAKELSDGSSGSFVSRSDLGGLSCPGDSIKCVASIDVNLTNLDRWGSTSPESGLSFHMTESGPQNVRDSFGVCKMYQALYDSNPDSTDSSLKCPTTYGGGDGGEPPEPCGDQVGEYHILMEGPAVDEGVMDDNEQDYRTCIDTTKSDVTQSSCNLRGDVVPEGHVADVAPPSHGEAKYEEGGNSPDWEVCLDLEGTGIGDEGDEVPGDNEDDDPDKQDYGGEWYDLDNERAQQYLRGSGSDLISGGDSDNAHDIAYYWNSQINPPQDEQYNPQGGKAGLALEDDCGNPDFDSLRCDDQSSTNSRGHGDTDTFFSFFEEGLKDEDFHPQGESGGEGNQLDGFKGVVNRLQERSDQLEPGMPTNVYDSSDYNRWEDTRGGDYADSWSISVGENWSVDSTGTPYPPYSAWYRSPSDRRSGPSSGSREKMQKAFGNSFAAVAAESFSYENEEGTTVQVENGDGVWIDPDMMKNIGDRYRLTEDGDGWRTALSREDRTGQSVGMKIDLTGPDAGLGVDVDSNEECLVSREGGGCKVLATGIDWEKEGDSGNLVDQLETPMCGDDRHEYLIEQAGESNNSEQYSGPYACSNSLNSCYHSDAPQGDRIVGQNTYRDVDEPSEDVGRLKDDREVCQKVEGQDDYALWYDQDYRKGFCKRNTLYGPEGVRWFDAEYVAKHPQAVSGGIDDSWNDYLSQIGHDNYTSDPSATSSEVTTDGDVTPVPTGDNNDVTATLGFCGGDDESEYLVTQECNTRYCETDRKVQGVAKVPGSCVLRAEEGLYETDVSERQVFKPGDQVEVTGVAGDPKIACFNGAWFSDWPVSFNQDEVSVTLGDTRTTSFDVVNIRNSETTFEVTMEPSDEEPGADQFASFVQHSGDTFTTTVEPTSSKTFQVEITGGNDNVEESDLSIRADALSAGILGSDSVEVSINPQAEIDTGRSSETEDVPGIQALQLLALTFISTLVFFTRGN